MLDRHAKPSSQEHRSHQTLQTLESMPQTFSFRTFPPVFGSSNSWEQSCGTVKALPREALHSALSSLGNSFSSITPAMVLSTCVSLSNGTVMPDAPLFLWAPPPPFSLKS